MAVIQHWENGEFAFKEAIARLTAMSQQAAADGLVIDQGRAEQILAYVQHYRGNLDASIHHNERARALYARGKNQRRVGIIDLNQGENFRFKGDFARAVRLFQQARRTAERYEDITTQTMATVNEGLVLLTLRQDMEARRVLLEGLELTNHYPSEREIDRTQLRRILCEIHHGMAVINLRAGDMANAWDEARRALEIAEDTGDPILRGYAYRTIGEVITEYGKSPDPRYSSDPDDHFRVALEAFNSLNAEAEIARTMYAQALSLAARGRRTTAARKLQHVMIAFSRLGMVDDAARAAEAQLSMT
ncbi:MAG: hypothetical protein ACOCXZ_00680 [Chloroflexota bacterium]